MDKGKGDILSLLIIHGYAGMSSCFKFKYGLNWKNIMTLSDEVND